MMKLRYASIHFVKEALLTKPEQPLNPRDLEQAFSLFNEASEQLAGAYHELQQRVEGLTQELTVANGELRRQFLEKQSLSQRLGLLLAALPGGVIVLDHESRVVEANPAALEMFSNDVIGKNWQEISRTSLQPTPAPHEWELRLPQDNNSVRWVNIVSSPLDSSGGRILLINDVTETLTMRQEFERHKRLSAMGEMVAGLAHQLRTPLSTALLYTANLNNANISIEDRQRFVDKALARLHHLERMIQDMLLFVKGETASQEYIKVSSIIIELTQVMEPQMNRHQINFDIVDQSVQAMVRANRKALVGALLNLLENALQACDVGGTVSLSARCNDKHVYFEVKDNGRGIEANVQERLFEPFYTTRIEGTGLGLAIVQSVIRQHGGEISFESQAGAGTTFNVRLPIYINHAEQDDV